MRSDCLAGGGHLVLQTGSLFGEAIQFPVQCRLSNEPTAEPLQDDLLSSKGLFELCFKPREFSSGVLRRWGFSLRLGLSALEVIIADDPFDDGPPNTGVDHIDSQHGKGAGIMRAPWPAPPRTHVVEEPARLATGAVGRTANPSATEAALRYRQQQ